MVQHPPGGFLAAGNAHCARNLRGAGGGVSAPDVTCQQVACLVVQLLNTPWVKECAGEHVGERAGEVVIGHAISWPGRQAGEQPVGRARGRANGRASERASTRAGGQARE